MKHKSSMNMAILGASAFWGGPLAYTGIHYYEGLMLSLMLVVGVALFVAGIAFSLIALWTSKLDRDILIVSASGFMLHMLLGALALTGSEQFMGASAGIFASVLVAAVVRSGFLNQGGTTDDK